MLTALALLARTHAEDGDGFLALAALRRGVALAGELGATRPLVEAGGEPVLALLRSHLGSWGGAETLVGEVLSRACVPAAPAVPLTERELDVLRELPTLRTVEEIASTLVVSTNTVKTHLRSVYRKLGVSTRRDAISEARRSGLL